MLTQEKLKTLLTYDRETGIFRWKVDRTGATKKGDIAGSSFKYIVIQIEGKRYYAHRLAWLYENGVLPEKLDHVNCNPADNRLENIRRCTWSDNNANRGVVSRSASGLKGVNWVPKMRKWRATAYRNRKQIHIGYYATAEEAHAAYAARIQQVHGEFARSQW